jgi:transposase-like protein
MSSLHHLHLKSKAIELKREAAKLAKLLKAAELTPIYLQEDEALLALEQFSDKWDDKYPQVSRSWTAHWNNLNTLFNYPEDIR